MSTDRDTTRIVRSWLEEGVTALPDRVLDAVLDQVPATSQRRPPWPVRRFSEMNNAWKLAIAAAAVVGVTLVGINLLPGTGRIVAGPGPGPTSEATQTSTPTPTPSPTPAASLAFPAGPLQAGTYLVAPFVGAPALGVCSVPPQPGCIEPTGGDSIRVTLAVPDGWSGINTAVWLAENKPPDGAALGFGRGAWLLSDPCQLTDADIPVGPTVDDFVDAIAAHPILDTTTPVDVTLDGYAGRYFDLQGPADLPCPEYRPWNPGIYLQGPGHRWHLWVLDVEGVRLIVQSMDYASTTERRRTELQAMVDSIRIEP